MNIFLLSQYPIGKCIHVRTDTWKSKKAKGSTWLKRGMIFNLESSHFFFLALSAVYNQAKSSKQCMPYKYTWLTKSLLNFLFLVNRR